MHQTTCGVTHKVEIFDRKHVERFLKEEKESFDVYQGNSSTIYDSKKIIDNASLNYLNEFYSKKEFMPDYQLKSILKKEFDNCEKLYPFLGEAFINLFFEKQILKSKKVELFLEKNINSFLATSKDENAKNVFEWIVKNSSTERVIELESSYNEWITIKKEDNIFFSVDFDCSFLGTKNALEMKNYRFAIIDGYIESVSEIHHMLHFAAKNKEPHVIFCFGMSDEVKQVIIQNNAKRITQIFPVSMSITEETVNILNDIALLHKSDIISSMKGQTISQEMRKELKTGNSITFTRKGFSINPLSSTKDIKSHIRYLKKRIEESPPDANTDIIRTRIKNMNSKSLKIYLPEKIKNSVNFNRELDYLLRMTKTSSKPYYHTHFDNRSLMLPCDLYQYVLKKVNTTKKIFYNIDKMLIGKE